MQIIVLLIIFICIIPDMKYGHMYGDKHFMKIKKKSLSHYVIFTPHKALPLHANSHVPLTARDQTCKVIQQIRRLKMCHEHSSQCDNKLIREISCECSFLEPKAYYSSLRIISNENINFACFNVNFQVTQIFHPKKRPESITFPCIRVFFLCQS